MHEKLVEDWLIKAGERGGIDQAFGQWLISQGHEILWIGHSRIEFGKDIVSIDPEGGYHAFQIKDEDLTLTELRKHESQISELISLPIDHPRIPRGSRHTPHLVTSGLDKEEVNHWVRLKNDSLRASEKPTLELVDRNSLVSRFVKMADTFWPEKPANIKDFFSFYLAEGKGDFDPKRFASILVGLLPSEDAPARKRNRCASALCLIGSYMLTAFDRESDHWSLFRGWIIIASHVAWFATKNELPEKHWKASFMLAKDKATNHLVRMTEEASKEGALAPRDFEFDEYTRCRNTVIAGAASLLWLLNPGGDRSRLSGLLNRLASGDRLIVWSEQAIPLLVCTHWATESGAPDVGAKSALHQYLVACRERNGPRSNDQPIEPPHTDIDDILPPLFNPKLHQHKGRRSNALWAMEAVVDLVCRRDERAPLEHLWSELTKLDIMSFRPKRLNDLLLWCDVEGAEDQRKLRKTESWKRLQTEAYRDFSADLPDLLRFDPAFAIMFFVGYPHRVSAALVGFLDKRWGFGALTA